VFGNQRLFTDSVCDFYAYLAGILSRYDLGGGEYAQFKELLLVYIDLITADVNRPHRGRRRLIAEAQRQAEQRRAAAAELALAGALNGATISPAARDLLLELVSDLLARHRAETKDHVVGLRLCAVPGPDTVVHSRTTRRPSSTRACR
jgi:hypothetical protein